MNSEIRALFPITERVIYLNHAAVSPPPTPAVKAVEDQLRDVVENGSLNYRSWVAVKHQARQLLAAMLGARPDQVAFLRNTSDGLSTVANGMSWRRTDNIVTFRHEFPSNIYPWLRIRDAFGVEVRMCQERSGRIEFEDLANLIDQNTRIVAISHIQYASGFKSELERIGRVARRHDALFVADVIQSVGVVPLNVQAELVDVAAAACHKWLLTPEGVGVLYLSDRAREMIEPTLVGWTSVPDPEDYNNFDQAWNPGALPWETGTGPTSLIHGLHASLQLLTTTGITRICAYLEQLTDHLCERLKSSEYEVISSRETGEKSQIVCIRHRGGLSAMDLYSCLKHQNIVTAPRGDRLRIAPHFYNLAEEIDQLVDSLPQA